MLQNHSKREGIMLKTKQNKTRLTFADTMRRLVSGSNNGIKVLDKAKNNSLHITSHFKLFKDYMYLESSNKT